MTFDPIYTVTFVGIVSFVLVVAYLMLTMRQARVGEVAGASDATMSSTEAATLASQPQDASELDRDLIRGGYYKPTAKRDFLALRNALMLLVLIVTGLLAVTIGPQREALAIRVLGAGLFVATLCWGVPRVMVAVQGRRRVERIRRALPDALDMVGMCVHGGLGLLDSLVHVSREIAPVHNDLATELLIVRRQADLNSPVFAFRQFAKRIDCPEVATLSSLIDQNQRLGTNVADSVRDFADTMRTKRRQAADAESSKAQLKLLFPVALCLVPSILIVLWGPAVLELAQYLQATQGPLEVTP